MPRLPLRQRVPRTVLSLSLPLSEHARATRAAEMSGASLAEFIREAMRQRANRLLGKNDEKLTAVDAAA